MSDASDQGSSPRVFGSDVPKTLFVLRHHFQKPPAEFADAYAGHRAFIDRNIAAGTFLGAGPVVPWDGGLILARAANRVAVDEIIATDPLVDAGITQYSVTEWKTTIRSSEFDSLLPG